MADIGTQLKFVNYHVGSRDVAIGFPILAAFDRDIVNVLFDADADSIEQTRHAWQTTAACETLVFPYCLSDSDRSETLHVNFDAYTSSIYPFNTDLSEFYTYYAAGRFDYMLGEVVRPMEQREVAARSLDSLRREAPFRDLPPDFLSVDTQGAELGILEGARDALARHVLGVRVEVEFVPIYRGQPLFRQVQEALEGLGFRLAEVEVNEEFSPHRGPSGARGRGFVLSGDALFLRRFETLAGAVASVEQRYVMLHKLAFVAVMFERLEYALQVLDAADRLRPPPALKKQLESLSYYAFLREMLAAAAALPPVRPPTMGEAMTFEQAQARFRA